jgi:hypothetical protein
MAGYKRLAAETEYCLGQVIVFVAVKTPSDSGGEHDHFHEILVTPNNSVAEFIKRHAPWFKFP